MSCSSTLHRISLRQGLSLNLKSITVVLGGWLARDPQRSVSAASLPLPVLALQVCDCAVTVQPCLTFYMGLGI